MGTVATAPYDLTTFDGWKAQALQLLNDKPLGTALVDRECGSFYLLFQGQVCSISAHEGEDMEHPRQIFTQDDVVPLSHEAWGTSAWDGVSEERTQSAILTPQFVSLNLA